MNCYAKRYLEKFSAYCGATELHFSNKTQILQSPSYPDPYPAEITCRWLLSEPIGELGVYFIHFTDFDLLDNEECKEEYVQITDYNVRNKYSLSITLI